MAKARRLSAGKTAKPKSVTFGVCSASDPRIDEASRQRCVNIVEMLAETVAASVYTPDGTPVDVVFSPVLIDGEKQADIVASQFRSAGVDAIICAPDTWAFPQPTLISLLAHFPPSTPLNITCGNSGPKPGVVYSHAVNGALAQSGRLSTLNVGNWADTGQRPKMSASTARALIDWCYAALTYTALTGRRVVLFGHDSMGMETALAHVIPTRRTFGIEITRLDMKLLSDMLKKGSYSRKELRTLRAWFDKHVGKRLEIRSELHEDRFSKSLAMYLILRDLMNELNAVGGGFMSQLEWGSDLRGDPLPVADAAESLFNSTFDHNGSKPPLPYATEADAQGLLTMLGMTWLSGGNPPLFMDFRKVWEPAEIRAVAKKVKVRTTGDELWWNRGFVDGDNSGSASFNWAGKPGASPSACMKKVQMPLAQEDYFPGGGNSVTFTTPGGIEGIAARMAYSAPTDRFSIVWDEGATVDLPRELAEFVANTSNWNWPHTWVVPKYATMREYKQYAPANHFHMTWDLAPRRLQYWMDMTGVLSVTPWSQRPPVIPETDRPEPLINLIGGR